MDDRFVGFDFELGRYAGGGPDRLNGRLDALAEHAAAGSVATVMFNLGDLLGEGHQLTTRTPGTLIALEAAAGLLKHVVTLSVVCYPGHPARTGEAPISPPSGPTQWLFQGLPAQSKVLAASKFDRVSILLFMTRWRAAQCPNGQIPEVGRMVPAVWPALALTVFPAAKPLRLDTEAVRAVGGGVRPPPSERPFSL